MIECAGGSARGGRWESCAVAFKPLFWQWHMHTSWQPHHWHPMAGATWGGASLHPCC